MLYLIVDNKGNFYHRAFTNKDTMMKEFDKLDPEMYNTYRIEDDLDFIGRSVCCVRIIRHGSSYRNGNKVSDFEGERDGHYVYSCADDAKQDDHHWKETKQILCEHNGCIEGADYIRGTNYPMTVNRSTGYSRIYTKYEAYIKRIRVIKN